MKKRRNFRYDIDIEVIQHVEKKIKYMYQIATSLLWEILFIIQFGG